MREASAGDATGRGGMGCGVRRSAFATSVARAAAVRLLVARHARSGLPIALALCALLAPAAARAFVVHAEVCGISIDPCPSPGNPLDVDATLRQTNRFSAAPGDPRGLHDGLSVGVTAGFAAAFGFGDATGSAQVESMVRSALAAWESPVLRFDVTFDAPTNPAVRTTGYEIELHAIAASDPLFIPGAVFGAARWTSQSRADRMLTTGAIVPGPAVRGGDVMLAPERFALAFHALALDATQRLALMQRVLMHEIGHVLGLDHPNEHVDANLDSDADPLSPVLVDPADPFAGLHVSRVLDPDAVMSNAPVSFEAGFFTALRPDDLAGRDVLYPVPEPGTASLLGAGLALFAGGRAHARRRRASGSTPPGISG